MNGSYKIKSQNLPSENELTHIHIHIICISINLDVKYSGLQLGASTLQNYTSNNPLSLYWWRILWMALKNIICSKFFKKVLNYIDELFQPLIISPSTTKVRFGNELYKNMRHFSLYCKMANVKHKQSLKMHAKFQIIWEDLALR